jgi:hypothetical protein
MVVGCSAFSASFGAASGMLPVGAPTMEGPRKPPVVAPPSRPKRPRPSFQFNLKTIFAATVLVASIAALFRFDWISVFAALGILFALFVFAEDIWPWLPR